MTTRPVEETGLRHSLVEDAFGLVTGTFVASLGIFLLKSAHAVTGGTAGLSLLLSYATGISFGVLYFVTNLPFLVLAFILGNFIALFNWSGIGSWIAVTGAEGLERIGQVLPDLGVEAAATQTADHRLVRVLHQLQDVCGWRAPLAHRAILDLARRDHLTVEEHVAEDAALLGAQVLGLNVVATSMVGNVVVESNPRDLIRAWSGRLTIHHNRRIQGNELRQVHTSTRIQ